MSGKEVRIDYIAGDSIFQEGSGNIGKVSVGAQQFNDQELAIDELRSLVVELKKRNLLTPSGEVRDLDKVRREVASRSSRLNNLRKALTSGSARTLESALGSTAAPFLIEVIKQTLGR